MFLSVNIIVTDREFHQFQNTKRILEANRKTLLEHEFVAILTIKQGLGFL